MFDSRSSKNLPFFKSYTKKSTKQKQKWIVRILLLVIIVFLFFGFKHSLSFSNLPPSSTTELHYNYTQDLHNSNYALEVTLSPPTKQDAKDFNELVIARETKLVTVGDRIPKIVHFVYGLRDPEPTLDLIHYIAIKSAHDILKPEKIIFHYHFLPVGQNFEKALPMLTLRQVPMVTNVFGRPVSHYAHKADVVRLQVLEEFGGIYLDLDLISLKPIDHLLDREFVMAQEGPFGSVGLCNAMMMARPHSRFIQRWYNTYNSFSSSDWNFHSVILPGKLAPFFRDEITVLNHTTFFWPLWDSHGLRTLYLEKSYDFSANLGTHIWESAANKNLMKDLTEKTIMEIDNSLYCQLRPFLLDGKKDARPSSCRILSHTERSDHLIGHWPLKEPLEIERKETNPMPAIDDSGNDLAGIIRNGKYGDENDVYLSGDTSYIFLNLPTKTSMKSLTVSWWMKTSTQFENRMAMVVQTDGGRLCVKTSKTSNGDLSLKVETIKRNDEWQWEQIKNLELRPSPYSIDNSYHHYTLVINDNNTIEPPIALYMDGNVIISNSNWKYPESAGYIIKGIWLGSIEPLNDKYQSPWDNSVNLEANYRDVHIWEEALNSNQIVDIYKSNKPIITKSKTKSTPNKSKTEIMAEEEEEEVNEEDIEDQEDPELQWDDQMDD